jgi:hypothetical protein
MQNSGANVCTGSDPLVRIAVTEMTVIGEEETPCPGFHRRLDRVVREAAISAP